MTDETDLVAAIPAVYAGPLEDFVRRRDTLVKALRSAKRREEANAVKALRKPSRLAWALDTAVYEAKPAFEALEEAVAGTADAQAAGGNVRSALAELRRAVRDFAGAAVRAAERAGYSIDEADAINATLAVLGSSDALDSLRRGCLADVPEAGGLDLLMSFAPPDSASEAKPKVRTTAAASSTAASDQRDEARESAREAAELARAALAAARAGSARARELLDAIDGELQAAEDELKRVEAKLRSIRTRRDSAQQEAEAAAARVLEAEKVAADAERQLKTL